MDGHESEPGWSRPPFKSIAHAIRLDSLHLAEISEVRLLAKSLPFASNHRAFLVAPQSAAQMSIAKKSHVAPEGRDRRVGRPHDAPQQPVTNSRRQPESSAATWLGDLLVQLARLAGADAARMPKSESVSIHALRVRMKKLRALLRLGRQGVTKSERLAVEECLRRIKDTVARQRDAEVLRKAARRLKLKSHAPKLASDSDFPKVRRLVAPLASHLDALNFGTLSWRGVAKAHAAAYRRCCGSMLRCASSGDAADFHRWRRRVKEFYYQSLALRRFTHADRLLSLQRLGNLLGRAHDLVLLGEHQFRQDAGPQTLKRIHAERIDLEDAALKKGRDLFRRSPGKFRRKIIRQLTEESGD